MKRLLGEKIGLRADLNKINLLFFLLFYSLDLSAQIPINGFCKFNSYNFSPGFSKLFPLNFNNDSYTDLILFNSALKKFSAVAGEQNETFKKEKTFDFPFPISNLAPLRNENNEINEYVFTSRKSLTAGICNFSSEGKPKVIHKYNFTSYPEKISTGDIDGDRKAEILISGPAFQGLSILKLVKNKHTEIIVKSSDSYSSAIFIDLSNDGFDDIAALNILTNSLEFYFNDGRGNFRFVRSISFQQKITGFSSFDMNLDSYQDLILLVGNKIKILYGDFASSYSKSVDIETKNSPADFIVGDFNKDGNIDVAYLSQKSHLVSVIFAKSEFSFYSEVLVLYKSGMKSLIPFYSRFIDGLAVICEDGTLLTNTKLLSPLSEVDLSMCLNPSAITSFDANSDEINDICFIDSVDNCLKLIVRNNEGVPTTYYSILLRGIFNHIAVKNFSKQTTSYFCYSNTNKLIEVIDVDFKTGKISRTEFYSEKFITDLKPFAEDLPKVFISSLTDKQLNVEVYEKQNTWKLLSDNKISETTVSSSLTDRNSVNLFYWEIVNDTLMLFKKTFLPEESASELLLKLNMKIVSKVITAADDFHNIDRESIISFAVSNEKPYILVSYGNNINIFKSKDINVKLDVEDLSQLFVSAIRSNGIRRLIVNNNIDNSFYRLSILKKGREIVFTKMMDDVFTSKFFIKNITVNNYHLVYFDQQRGCISIRQI